VASGEPRLVLVDTFKGGVGKTTTSRWLAASLADLGETVLLGGLSPQNDAASAGGRVSHGAIGMRDAIASGRAPSCLSIGERVMYVPAGLHNLKDVSLQGAGERYRSLAAERGCSWCVVDGINFLQEISWWVLDAADVLVVPSPPVFEAVAAGLRTLRAVSEVKESDERARRLEVARILLLDMPSPSQMPSASKQILAAIEERYGPLLFSTRIRRTTRRELGTDTSGLVGVTRTNLGGPRLKEDYAAFAKELVSLVNGVEQGEVR
jgi:cellulose biosynthesis protein BcsQ